MSNMANDNTSNIPTITVDAGDPTRTEHTEVSLPSSTSRSESHLQAPSVSLGSSPEVKHTEHTAVKDLFQEFEKFANSVNEKYCETFLKVCYLDAFVLRSGFSLLSYGVVAQQGQTDRIVANFMPPFSAKDTWDRSLLATNESEAWEQVTWTSIYKANTILKAEKATGLNIVLLSRKNVPSLQVLTYWRCFTDYLPLREEDRSHLCYNMWIAILRFMEFDTQSLLPSYPDHDRYFPSKLKLRLPSECIDTPSVRKLSFAWPISIPSGGALNLYVWQSYKQRAAFNGVTISWVLSNPDKVQKILFLFDTAEDLQRFSKYLSERHADLVGCCEVENKVTMSTVLLDRILLTLLRFTVANHKSFLESVAMNLYDLDILARNKPGRSKALYLYSLKDYLDRQYEEIQTCLNFVIGRDIHERSEDAENEARSILEDLEYLGAKSTTAKDDVTSMMARLATLRDFKQAQQVSITNFLVGLYVPLAFVTGFFGMNTTEINGSILPTSRFVQIAVPLTVITMVGPLIFGPMIRSSAIFSVKASKTMAIYWPFIMEGTVHGAAIIYWLILTFWHVAIELPNHVPWPATIVLHAASVILAFLEVLCAYLTNYSLRRALLVYWLVTLMVMISCFIASPYDQTHFVTLFLPWLFFNVPPALLALAILLLFPEFVARTAAALIWD